MAGDRQRFGNHGNAVKRRPRTFVPTKSSNNNNKPKTKNGGTEAEQKRQIRGNQKNTDSRILYVNRLLGRGRRISLRNLVYAFNHAAQFDDGSDEFQVLDVYFPFESHFAYIQMRSVEAAQRALERMNNSWLIDKYINVQFGRKYNYDQFLSNRTTPSLRVTFGQNVNNSSSNPNTHAVTSAESVANEAGEDGQEQEEVVDEEKMRKNTFIAKMPLGVTRHLRPGTYAPSNKYNNQYVRKEEEEDREREVERTRNPQSPVLVVTGIESEFNGKLLTRYDLIMLFSCYGEVVDCDVYLTMRQRQMNPDGLPSRHHALVQMRLAEQATRAMNALDYSWQMGRFIKVTYAREQSILVSNEEIKQRYQHKRCGGNSRGKMENGAMVEEEKKDEKREGDETEEKEKKQDKKVEVGEEKKGDE